MIEISKELLSEVLDCSIDKYTIVSSTEITQIRIWKKDAEMWDYRSYDIHHLTYKCKIWALGKNYTISSMSFKKGNRGLATLKNSRLHNESLERFKDNSEPEAIFKACEWIYMELNK